MNVYRLTIEPYSAFRTPLQSDTIFGHLLWALRYTAGQEGNAALEKFLGHYRSGEPPLLVSAGFPANTLPVPVLEQLPPDPTKSIADRTVADLLRKVRQELDYLPLSYWNDLASKVSSRNLENARKKLQQALEKDDFHDYRRQRKVQAITRTAVDRITGSGRDGRLFVAEETFYGRPVDRPDWPPARFDVWHKLDEEQVSPTDVQKWWHWIERNGFGKRKSTGAGAFKIVRDLEPAAGELPQVDQPNGFVSLSAWVPAINDPLKVSYKTRVKRGKLAEQYAIPGLEHGPWKKPLLMLAPGALARLPAGEAVREWYGQLVEDMHWTRKGIVQYGYGFPLGVCLVKEKK